jgi:hypothetical protein
MRVTGENLVWSIGGIRVTGKLGIGHWWKESDRGKQGMGLWWNESDRGKLGMGHWWNESDR